jgi:hypothetical protein
MMDVNTVRLIINKGVHHRVLRRVMVERLTEPLHLNMASAFVAVFGGFRAKVAFDLVYKQPYARHTGPHPSRRPNVDAGDLCSSLRDANHTH